jgi:L-2-hydroxyglutarate oxidase
MLDSREAEDSVVDDFCVVGGGIVGMATAMALLRARPGASIVVLEKELELARHQTGHNSGVIHSGIYYEPGSLKAELCVRGARAIKEFSAEHGIPVINCGKLIVATNEVELGRLNQLAERSTANGVEIHRVGHSELRSLEPNVEGRAALLVPSTAIVDYRAITMAMARVVQANGGHVAYGSAVTELRESSDRVDVVTQQQTWSARHVVVCAGLQADRMVRAAGLRPTFRTVPFRGEYYRLDPALGQLVNHLIYPVPDPSLPFLGVHLTLTTGGGITVGPNAVLGLAREGYRRGAVSARDMSDFLTYAGFWRFARHHVGTAAVELRNSIWKQGYLRECHKYCPSLQASDLMPHDAGIRAQALLADGTLVHDFLIQSTPRTSHVCNAPSPAATSAITIAEEIVRRVLADAGRL